jgi:hypothetical protein
MSEKELEELAFVGLGGAPVRVEVIRSGPDSGICLYVGAQVATLSLEQAQLLAAFLKILR